MKFWENYTTKAWYAYVLLCIGLLPNTIYSQYSPADNSCPIFVPGEPGTLSKSKSPLISEQYPCVFGGSTWSGYEAIKVSDDAYVQTTISAGGKSSCLVFRGFDMHIPDDAEIMGIEFVLEGHVIGASEAVKASKVQMVINDQEIGHNKNKAVSLGTAFPGTATPQDFNWRYGYGTDLWNAQLTTDILNDSEFGLFFQLENSSDQLASVFIDRIVCKVFYRPIYTICNHDCITFLVNDDPDASFYEWTIPDGYSILSGTEVNNAINIVVNDISNFGPATICLDILNASRQVIENCCRDFVYDNCTPRDIGDYVWEDLNANGIQDNGEQGLQYIRVDLYDESDNFVASTFTDSEGKYIFKDIEKGYYYIQVSPENGYLFSPSFSTNTSVNSDITGQNGYGTSSTFYLSPDADRLDIDAGLVLGASIGDFVWEDLNGNGIQDIGENGISGISLSLMRQGVVLETTLSQEDGSYVFDNLLPLSYTIKATAIENFNITLSDQGTDDAMDSDFDSSGNSITIDLTPGQENNSVDLGLFKYAQVGDFVWFDNDQDGIQDQGEAGLSNFSVHLFDFNNSLIGSTMTDSVGKYSFDQLRPGEYFLRIDIPQDYLSTLSNVGDNEALDSDFYLENEELRTDIFLLTSDAVVTNVDAGFYFKPAKVLGITWHDHNGNGIQEMEDEAISDISIALYDESQSLIGTTLTDVNGEYSFMAIVPGDYYVVFGALENHVFSPTDIGQDDRDSDVTSAVVSGSSDVFSLSPDQTLPNISAGYVGYASIGDFVWFDTDQDGIQDAEEEGLINFKVDLYNDNEELIQSVQTEADGSYQFEKLLPGNYKIEIEFNKDYKSTILHAGSDLLLDSDFDVEDILPYPSIASYHPTQEDGFLNLQSRDLRNDIDAGFYFKPATIKGVAWHDSNGNGIQEGEEETIPNLTISLFDQNDVLVNATISNSSGSYLFENIVPGKYYVKFSTLENHIFSPAGIGSESMDSDVTESLGIGTTDLLSLSPDEKLTDINAGYIGYSSIGDYVWEDINLNGIQDDGASGLNGFTVKLYNSLGIILNTTTSTANPSTGEPGYYIFEKLLPGDYFLVFESTDDYIPAINIMGKPNIDSDIDESLQPGSTRLISVVSRDHKTDIDGGLVYNKGIIQGTIWDDLSYDGQRGDADLRLEDIHVTLFDSSDNFISDRNTDINGYYSFEDIPVGMYYVKVDLLEGYIPTLTNVGSDSSDSDILADGSSDLFEVRSSRRITTIDGGIVDNTSDIVGIIWCDDNRDGIRQTLEKGIANQMVNLYDNEGTLLMSKNSIDDGNFLFPQIPQGSYYLGFQEAINKEFTLSNVGEDDTIDSDVTHSLGIGTTDLFDIGIGGGSISRDAGQVLSTGRISGKSWLDKDVSNTFESDNDELIAAIEVSLYSEQGQFLSSTNTNSNGEYFFELVPVGSYYLVFGSNPKSQYVVPNIGSDQADSDVSSSFVIGSTDLISVKRDDDIQHIDVGFVINIGSISGQVWLDENQNGINDAEESGIGSIKVSLFTAIGGFISEMTTNGNGNYTFGEIPSAEYYLVFDINNDYVFSAANQGVDSADSDVTSSIAAGSTDIFKVDLGGENEVQDAGLIINRSDITGFIFCDLTENGLRDGNDFGLGPINIEFYDSSGILIQSLQNQTGTYRFDNILSGDYYVKFDQIAGKKFTSANIGVDENIDSDITSAFGIGTTDVINVVPGGTEYHVDAGYIFIKSSISGKAWKDDNNNDVRDQNENGISNVEVNLIGAFGVQFDRIFTDAFGNYSFDNLLIGEYQIVFGDIENLIFVAPNIGDDPTLDSDVTNENGLGSTKSLFLTDELGFQNIDAGFVTNVANITGIVWCDENRDGIRQTGESQISDQEVVLYDSENNNFIATSSTQSDGSFLFSNIVSGKYYLKFVESLNKEFTMSNIGSDDSIDSDVTNQSGIGTTDIFEIVPGGNAIALDAGQILSTGKLSGKAWLDLNANNTFDAEDQLLSSIDVKIYSEAGSLVSSTITSNGGNYSFDLIPVGNYYLVFGSFPMSQYVQPFIGTSTTDSDVTSAIVFGSSNVINVQRDSDITNIDAGYIIEVSDISGQVWLDVNNDGINNEDEPKLPAIQVQLFNADGLLDQKTSDNQGNYTFSNVPASQYYVVFVLPIEYLFTTANQGSDDRDSDVTSSVIAGSTDLFAVSLGGVEIYQDAGLIPNRGSVSGQVWLDVNCDGIRQENEAPINNVQIEILDNNNAIVAQQTTDNDGQYFQSDLLSGEYIVKFESLEQKRFTLSNQGNDDQDSDVTNIDGTTDKIAILPGQNTGNVDGGYRAIIGLVQGVLWLDKNYDGIRQVEEERIGGSSIHLHDANGIIVASTRSDNDGLYEFEGIKAGAYYISITKDSGYIFTIPNQGDDALDSDITSENGPGTSSMLSINNEGDVISIDAGLVKNIGTIQGMVWLEELEDGLRQDSELGVGDIKVELLNAQGEKIDETLTDENGFYSFPNVISELYYILIRPGIGRGFTLANVGMDDALDSDITSGFMFGSSEVIQIEPIRLLQEVDAGLVILKGSISGIAWEESSQDGIRQNEEILLPNIAVSLFAESGDLQQSTSTDDEGRYDFSNVSPGKYYIVFGLENGYDFTTPGIGNEDRDSDVSNSLVKGSTDLFELQADGSSVQDAGYIRLLSEIVGLAWLDTNRNGIRETSESTLVDVEVKLFNDQNVLVNSTFTDGSGTYSIDDVLMGSYYLVFQKYEDRTFTFPNIGDDATDSDVINTLNLGETENFEISIGGSQLSFDAGYVESVGSISGLAWLDQDEDGIRSVEEIPKSEVVIELFSQDGVMLAQTLTDDQGIYSFSNLISGSYYIVAQLPDNHSFTLADQGGNDDIDADITSATTMGSSDIIVVFPNQEKGHVDIGLISSLSMISGFTWVDSNANGQKDMEEEGLTGVNIALYNQMGEKIDEQPSDQNGNYKFNDISEGKYYLIFTTPIDYLITDFQVMGADPAIDSDVSNSIAMGSTDTLNIQPKQLISGINAGYYQLGSISGEAWLDNNENNSQDPSDTFLNGVIVTIFNSVNEEIESLTIDETGIYQFNNLKPDIYVLQFTLPVDYAFAVPSIGDEASDSDVIIIDGLLGTTDGLTISSGQNLTNVDAGAFEDIPEFTTIGNFVWHDLNGNGLIDPNEPGINGIEVELYNTSNILIKSTITAEDMITGKSGSYIFTEIVEGQYYLKFGLPEGYQFTKANIGSNEVIDSDVIGFNGETDVFTISGTITDLNYDAGMFISVKIGDYVWGDGNFNGIQDDYETGIDGIRVRLFSSDGTQVDQTFTVFDIDTGKSGYYQFITDPGKYYLRFDLAPGLFFSDPDIGDDDTIDSDVTSVNGNATTATFTLLSGEVNQNMDVGMLQEPGSIGDKVWLDLDGNGIFDAQNEPGVNDIGVNLYRSDGIKIDSTTTKLGGKYLFDNVPAGEYYVEFVIPEIYAISPSNEGANDRDDSDITNALGRGTTSIFSISSNEIENNIDAGIFIPAGIGDFVWFDENGNGAQDEGEPGVEGVSVTLFSQSNLPLAQTTTDVNGKYLFTNLKKGLYYIKFEIDDQYQFTTFKAIDDDTKDSDAFPSGSTVLVSLAHGVQFLNFDAGLVNAKSLVGSTVWHDTNADGIRSPSEEGIMDVEVMLHAEDGEIINRAFTDVKGNYIFQDLPDGNYYVEFVPPNPYFVFTHKKRGNDNTRDSDVDQNGLSDMMPVSQNLYYKHIDAGLFQVAQIQASVWNDGNADGIYENGEAGIENVSVSIMDLENKSIEIGKAAPSQIDQPNIFTFDGVRPGNYMLMYDVPYGMVAAQPINASSSDMVSNAYESDGEFRSTSFSFYSGEIVQNINAGFYKGGIVGDRVWLDSNGNGIQDIGEKGLNNVVINLRNELNEIVQSQVSDKGGHFEFHGVKKGRYYLEFDSKEYNSFTVANSYDDEYGSDVNHSNGIGTTSFFDVIPEYENYHMDAGLILGVLALEDYSFTGRCMGAYNLLNLSPKNEDGIDHFELYKWMDGEEFEMMREIAAEGKQEYVIEDADIKDSGVYYYQVIEVDVNGFRNGSKVISINVDHDAEESIVLYPNPLQDRLYMEANDEMDIQKIEVYNHVGQLIERYTKSSLEDRFANKRLSFEMGGYVPGEYVIIVHSTGKKQVYSVIKQ